MNWRLTLTLLLLAAAIASTFAIIRQRASLRPTGAAAYRPDYVLRDFEIITLQKDGSEGFTLKAPKLERNPDDKTMQIATPEFMFPDKTSKTYWHSTSKSAWVSAQADEVRLRGDVLLHNPDNGKNMRVETQSLDVFPNANRASSSDQVTVTQPGATISGRGMVALLDQDRVTLKSEVRARYAPSIR